MALQVRLRHALGERIFELPEQPAAEPLIVGRGRDATLQVPSISVAAQHLVLFVHEGGWVVQPMSGVVTVNGNPVDGPRLLQIGDIVGLGAEANAPTLQIDPFSAAQGRTGPALAGRIDAPVQAVRAMNPAVATLVAPSPAPAPRSPRRMAPPGIASAFQMPPAAPPPPDAAAEAEGDADGDGGDGGDTIDWNPAAASMPQPTRYYVPKPKKTSEGMIVVAVMFVAIILGVVVWRFHNSQLVKPIVKEGNSEQQKPLDDEPSTPRVKTIFNSLDERAPAPQPQVKPISAQEKNPTQEKQIEPAAAVPPSDAETASTAADKSRDSSAGVSESGAVTAPPPATPDRASPQSDSSEAPPAATDKTMDDVESSHLQVKKQGVAIVKCDEYRQLHPGKYEKILDQYIEDAVDRLWWEQVAVLWDQRSALEAQIKQKELDLKAEPAGGFHDQLAGEKVNLAAQRDSLNDKLATDFGYTADTRPDLTDPAKLKTLSKGRDPGKYAAFKRRILHYVRDHHGGTWWDGQ
jgi:pSer/pThr/pTyr-binding forkhead associated (FHA) protein